jgi:hypothetical protein
MRLEKHVQTPRSMKVTKACFCHDNIFPIGSIRLEISALAGVFLLSRMRQPET